MALGIGTKAIVGTLGGLALGAYNDRRQRKQQQKLQDQQIKGAKELKDYENKKQMEIWNETNYGAQVEHLKKAGLNPALMYGMGGEGGSLGSGGMPQPTEATAEGASQGARSIMDAALMKAQTRVLETQADKNQAEADKTGGVDTKGQEITNRRNELETKLRENLGLDKLGKHAEIKMEAENVKGGRDIREFEEWMNQAFTNELDEGHEVKTDALGSYITNNNDLIKEATKAGIQEKIQTISNLVKKFELDESQEALNKIEAEIRDFRADLAKWGLNEQTTNILNTILKAMFARGGRR